MARRSARLSALAEEEAWASVAGFVAAVRAADVAGSHTARLTASDQENPEGTRLSVRNGGPHGGRRLRRSRLFGPKPKANRSQAHREQAPHHVAFDAAEIKATGAGAWTGPRAAKRRRGGRKGRVWTGRIVAVLLGRPEDDDWDKIIEDMERILAGLRRRGIKRGVFTRKKLDHRRGKFPTLYDGYSHGGGQRSKSGVRLAGGFSPVEWRIVFQKCMGDYEVTTRAIERNQPELRRPFKNSIYSGVTWNLGPETVTAEHCDSHNRAHGVCPVTAMGDFDYKKGGHLYMRKLKCVIEFPPRSSAAILSGAGETRYSMTQYTAEYGFQTARSLLETEGGAEKKAQIDGAPGVRAAQAVGLLSKYDELEADRRMVFGG
ncbi:hypothetical protein B0H14DRAFT_2605979 [Mycena olivaceomarginata]|nr:hypothetical protein B0H14DRAFT_2605979 [Mycena olivaceomarginata]